MDREFFTHITLLKFEKCMSEPDLWNMCADMLKNITNWGNSNATGRGLMALVGKGHIFAVSLKQGEQYIVHPRCVS